MVKASIEPWPEFRLTESVSGFRYRTRLEFLGMVTDEVNHSNLRLVRYNLRDKKVEVVPAGEPPELMPEAARVLLRILAKAHDPERSAGVSAT